MQKVIEATVDLSQADVTKEQVNQTLSAGMTMRITDRQSYQLIVGHLKGVKSLMKQWDEKRKFLKKPMLDGGKRIDDFFSPFMDKMKEQEKKIKSMIVAYDTEQEKKRQEEQAKLDAIAEKKRLEKEEQERKWKEKEEAKRAEAARLEAEGKAEEAAKAQAEADKAADKAEERAEEAETVEAPVIAKEEKPSGISYRMKYTGIVVDFAKLPDSYKIVNQSMLDKTIQAQKGAIPIPGVEIKEEKIAAVRR